MKFSSLFLLLTMTYANIEKILIKGSAKPVSSYCPYTLTHPYTSLVIKNFINNTCFNLSTRYSTSYEVRVSYPATSPCNFVIKSLENNVVVSFDHTGVLIRKGDTHGPVNMVIILEEAYFSMIPATSILVVAICVCAALLAHLILVPIILSELKIKTE